MTFASRVDRQPHSCPDRRLKDLADRLQILQMTIRTQMGRSTLLKLLQTVLGLLLTIHHIRPLQGLGPPFPPFAGAPTRAEGLGGGIEANCWWYDMASKVNRGSKLEI